MINILANSYMTATRMPTKGFPLCDIPHVPEPNNFLARLLRLHLFRLQTGCTESTCKS